MIDSTILKLEIAFNKRHYKETSKRQNPKLGKKIFAVHIIIKYLCSEKREKPLDFKKRKRQNLNRKICKGHEREFSRKENSNLQ